MVKKLAFEDRNSVATEAIKLENVTVSFDEDIILQKINLSVKTGEIWSIIGPSGQGKSVLIKTMAGLIQPSTGSVYVMGQDWTKIRGATKTKLLSNLGMLFQKNALFDSLTCGENIAFPLREATDFSEVQIEELTVKFLEAVGIRHAKDLFPDEISGGMQKRLGIARALALNPKIIFYDDPTAGLDPITSRKIIDLILTLQKQNNTTVVSITNDMNRAYQMANKIAMVVDKSVIITGSPEETKNHKDLRVHQFIRGELTGPLMVIQ